MLLDLHDKSNDLRWAVGKTARTSFVWTLTPPGTRFCNGAWPVVSEIRGFSIFKWAHPLISAIDVPIDELFIAFLKAPHTRKEYKREFLGTDSEAESFRFFRGLTASPLPPGNHSIALGKAARILR